MPPAGVAALFFTVVLLVTTAYFLMGGLPLLILAHDTPVDQKFIQRFFEIYYKAAVLAAGCATLAWALWGRLPFAAGTAAIVLVTLALRRRIIPAMAHLAAQIQARDERAVRAFRRVHTLALSVNLAQLVLLVWGVTQVRL